MLRGKSMTCYRHEWKAPNSLICEFDDNDNRIYPPVVNRERQCMQCGVREPLPECLHVWEYNGAMHDVGYSVFYERCNKCNVRISRSSSTVVYESSKVEQAYERGFDPNDYIDQTEQEEE